MVQNHISCITTLRAWCFGRIVFQKMTKNNVYVEIADRQNHCSRVAYHGKHITTRISLQTKDTSRKLCEGEKDTALVLRSWIEYIFTFGTIYFHSTWSRNVWLPNRKTGLTTTVNSRTPSKIIVLELLKLRSCH